MSRWRQFRQLYSIAPLVFGAILVGDIFLQWVFCGQTSLDPIVAGLYLMNRSILYFTMAFCLISFRFFRDYPSNDARYLQWLRLTPWTVDKPLPVGSLFWGWYDFGVVVALSAAAWFCGPIAHPAMLPLVMVGWSAVALSVYLLAAMQWRALAGGAPFVAVAVAFGAHLWVVLGALFLLLMYLNWQWRACLVRFHEIPLHPGEEKLNRALIFWGENAQPALQIEEGIGPTHALPHTDKIAPILPWWYPSVMACLAGGAGWLIAGVALEEGRPAWVPSTIGLLVALAAVVRCVAYLPWPPLSLWGRLRTGRWVIPAYDRALIVPGVILAAGFLSWSVLTGFGVSLAWVAAGTLALTTLLAFGAGPTRGQHRLTGAQHYRAWSHDVGNVRTSAGAREPALRRTRALPRS